MIGVVKPKVSADSIIEFKCEGISGKIKRVKLMQVFSSKVNLIIFKLLALSSSLDPLSFTKEKLQFRIIFLLSTVVAI